MPSFSTYISIIDTKEWAVNVLEDVLSDNPPIAFEPLSPPCYPDEKHESSSWINHPLGNDDGLHRSLSLPDDESYCSEDLRSPSFSIPSATHSDPGTLPSIVNGFHVAKLSSFKRRLSFKRLLFSSEALLYRSTCWKVQKGLEIWRSTLESSMEQKEPIEKGVTASHLSHFIMTELLSTEATYLDHLMIIKKEFMNPLHSAAKQRPRPLVRMEDVEVIFAFIPQLIILSTALFCRLHDTIHYATEHSGQGIGRVFCDLEDQFAVYIFYAVNFSKLQKCLAKTADNIVYRQLVQNSLRKKETNRMGLSDYMIAPIQRITRYCLLLKDLKKRTSPSHLDYPYLDRALKSLSALAWAMNDIQ